MKIIGLGKENIEEGKIYEVSDQVSEVLIKKGLAYLQGTEKPTVKKKRKVTK
jgi:hypothetical protein